MRIVLCCAAAALLAGCSTPIALREAWAWDVARPQPRPTVPASEVAALTNRVAELQLQRNEIRTRISAEPDILARQQIYADLHELGMRLSPLERQLAALVPAR